MIVVAGSMMLPLGACSRTSDGTVVMDNPVALPSLNLKVPKPQLPSWMKRKEPEPVVVAQNFPPPPAKKVVHRRRPGPRRDDGYRQPRLQECQRGRPRPHGLRVTILGALRYS